MLAGQKMTKRTELKMNDNIAEAHMKQRSFLAIRTIQWALAILTSLLPAAAIAQGLEQVYYIQIKLDSLGYEIGPHDGVMGNRTRAAMADLAAERGFDPSSDGMISYYMNAYYQYGSPITDEVEIEQVKTALGQLLLDPFSARIKDVLLLPSGNICGLVNAKNTYGAYTGFQHFMALSIDPVFEGGEKFIFSPTVDGPDSRKAEYLCLLDVDFSS